ncbi:glutaredoxin family protein [Zoogloea sp.]|uniref:glutaredoxin family protein n=1 Tax=Zoogloea sp. TaxID=49181 RepID=UPI0035B33FF9
MTARRLFGLLLLAAALPAAAQNAYRWVDEKGRVQYSDQPPPQSVKKFEERKLQANRANAQQQSYATRKAAADFPVTLYVGKDCGQACDSARTLLNKRGIPFSEALLQTEAEVAAFKSRFSKDPVAPSLLVGKTLESGFAEAGWNSLLSEAGYPTTKQP